MSASLVGSEMCIRDRVRSAQSCPAPLQLHELRAGRGKAGPVDRGRLVPVSYTHLTLPTICSV
eukprot:5020114-Alexandrium_andersonii.AAC.1